MHTEMVFACFEFIGEDYNANMAMMELYPAPKSGGNIPGFASYNAAFARTASFTPTEDSNNRFKEEIGLCAFVVRELVNEYHLSFQLGCS